MTHWAGVRERLQGIGSIGGKVFGAGTHRFALADPLTEEQLLQAEQEWGIALPAEYRSFLGSVGAGGAGPGYGLFAPARTADGWWWPDQVDGEREDLPLEFLSEPERARLDAEHAAREPREAGFADHDAFRAAFRAWDAEWEALRRRMTAGSVQLSHQGCGYYHWLVVTGPHRGTVWEDGFGTGELMAPIAPDFRTWYLNWLAAAEREARRTG